MLSEDFEMLSRLVKAESGLSLTPDKAYLFETRLLPIAQKWKFASLEQLTESLRTRRDAAQIRDVTEAMTVNESFFFRDVKPFDLLRDKLLPALRAARAGKTPAAYLVGRVFHRTGGLFHRDAADRVRRLFRWLDDRDYRH